MKIATILSVINCILFGSIISIVNGLRQDIMFNKEDLESTIEIMQYVSNRNSSQIKQLAELFKAPSDSQIKSEIALTEEQCRNIRRYKTPWQIQNCIDKRYFVYQEKE